MKDTKKKNHIAPFLWYLFFLLVVMGIFLLYARKSLILYEAAQPTHVMEAFVQAVSENGLRDFTLTLPDFADQGVEVETNTTYDISVIDDDIVYTRYENDEAFRAALDEQIAAYGVTYRFLREDYTDGALRYALYSGDICLGTTALTPGRSYQRMLLLTMTEWFPQDITLYRDAPACTVTASMPEDHTLYVNGLRVPTDAIVARQPYDGLDYCREYVTIPDEITMTVSALYETPEVEIRDGSGSTVYRGMPETEIEVGFATLKMPEELSSYVLSCVERYSNFFTKDLPGAAAGIDPIRDLFPEGSIYLELAERYRREDMGVVAGHYNTHFLNEAVTEYTVYGADCFSCHVYFDKSMSLGAREMIDTTDNSYYFVNLNDHWVIADIR